MTTFNLNNLDALLDNDTNSDTRRDRALNMDNLEKNKPYILKEYEMKEYVVDGEDQESALGTLSDDRQIWIPKRMLRMLRKKGDGPWGFVYKGRDNDKYKSHMVNVFDSDVLRKLAILRDVPPSE